MEDQTKDVEEKKENNRRKIKKQTGEPDHEPHDQQKPKEGLCRRSPAGDIVSRYNKQQRLNEIDRHLGHHSFF